jgi:hypothetical protein
LSKDLTLITLGIQSYIANLSGRQDCEGNMLGKRQNRQLLDTQLTDVVHIIADKSSKVAEGHHRHSTNPVVSCSLQLIYLVGGETVLMLVSDVSQRGGWRRGELAHPRHCCLCGSLHHCICVCSLQHARR